MLHAMHEHGSPGPLALHSGTHWQATKTPHSPRMLVGAVRASLADNRGEVRTNTGDQTGREGGHKKAKDRIRTHVGGWAAASPWSRALLYQFYN
jgi:hypothetical protein